MAISDNTLKTSKNKIENYFIDKGFLYTECTIESLHDSTQTNKVILNFNINKSNRLKIKKISFSGNTNISSKKLKKAMKETKETGLRYLFSSSKMIEEKYKGDLNGIITLYHQKGYRDIQIVSDSLSKNEDGLLMIDIEISEGKQYFFGDIKEYTILALLPSYLENKNSSLIYMINKLILKTNKQDSGFYLNNYDELRNKLIALKNQKVLLFGVTFALLNLLEKFTFQLPNLTIIETGGMKGRRKEIIREELHLIIKQGLVLI